MALVRRYRLPLVALLAVVGAMVSPMSSANADFPVGTPASCRPGNPTNITHQQEHSEGQTYWSFSATAITYCNDTTGSQTQVKEYIRFGLYYDAYSEKTHINGATYGPHTLPLGLTWATPADRRTGYLTSCVHNHYYYLHTNTYYWWYGGGMWHGPNQWDSAAGPPSVP